jgi:hypothetical protein
LSAGRHPGTMKLTARPDVVGEGDLRLIGGRHMAQGLRSTLVGAGALGGVILLGGLYLLSASAKPPEEGLAVAVAPKISPDYSDLVIPPNIAPLNFRILEPGQRFFARLHADAGRAIEVFSRTGRVCIPVQSWRALLAANRGGRILLDIYVKDASQGWRKFQSLSNTVAQEEVDSYVVYRRMPPVYNWWKDIGIYQRPLAGYEESGVLYSRSFEQGCPNCHSFAGNDPGTMTIALRSAVYGSSTLLARSGSISKIGAKWGYTAWHPSGTLAVYSLNEVRQFFHAGRLEVRDVVDIDSALVCYRAEDHRAICPAPLADKERLETYPSWSPDGQYLYFCSAPVPWKDRNQVPPEDYDKVRYDLRRVPYDVRTQQWGPAETVLSAEQTGLSILLPRISPDGRFLLFCMCAYGCFPAYQPSSDLYLMDLATRKYQRLAINSGYSESWHSWSSNSRWIAFSSKRQGGFFTRTYLSYVNTDGQAHKAFVLPQRDPDYYDSLVETYSVPELVTGPVRAGRTSLARAARADASGVIDIPITMATPKATKTLGSQERE